jgi:hypothetical protein
MQTSTRYSNSSHIHCNCDSLMLAMVCEILSWRYCGVGGWYTWPFTYSYRDKSRGVRSGNLGGQGIAPAPPIQPSSRFLDKKSLRAIQKWGTAPFCWIWSWSGKSPFKWGQSSCSSISRCVIPVTVASTLKKGPYTFVFDTAQNMLTLGESRVTQTMTCSCSVLQMSTFFMFTLPGSWKVIHHWKWGSHQTSHQFHIARSCLHKTLSI